MNGLLADMELQCTQQASLGKRTASQLLPTLSSHQSEPDACMPAASGSLLSCGHALHLSKPVPSLSGHACIPMEHSQSQQPGYNYGELHASQLSEQQAIMSDASLSITDQISSVAAAILDTFLAELLPTVSLTPSGVGMSQADALNPGARSQQLALDISKAAGAAACIESRARSQSQAAKRKPAPPGLTISPDNVKVTDRFCRAMVLLDAIHVRSTTPRPHSQHAVRCDTAQCAVCACVCQNAEAHCSLLTPCPTLPQYLCDIQRNVAGEEVGGRFTDTTRPVLSSQVRPVLNTCASGKWCDR